MTHKPQPRTQEQLSAGRPLWVRAAAKVAQFLFVGQIIVFGLLLVVVQLALNALMKLSRRRGWRKRLKTLNSRLTHIVYSPSLAFVYYWNDARLRLHAPDAALLEQLSTAKMLGLLITNHSFAIDFVLLYTLVDQLGRLHSLKTMSKQEVKYLPIAGWNSYLSDTVFVRRDWQADRASLGPQLDELLDCDSALFALYAEGTRFTARKFAESLEFARRSQMEPFRHHLAPRPRGFVFTLRHLLRQVHARGLDAELPVRLFNLQCLMARPLDMGDIIAGRRLCVDVVCEELDISGAVRREALESADERDCPRIRQLLYDIYRRKDELVDAYKANGCRVADARLRCRRDCRARPEVALLALGLGVASHALLGYWAWRAAGEWRLVGSAAALWLAAVGALYALLRRASSLADANRGPAERLMGSPPAPAAASQPRA